jgi:hypothetical protein
MTDPIYPSWPGAAYRIDFSGPIRENQAIGGQHRRDVTRIAATGNLC